ncbi:MAG: class IV adenylate cyclase [Acidobacteria bacterium]|nr:class IV adenylate cyclase [Acidobacteriota bacterium]
MEIKLAVRSPASVRGTLRRLGFRVAEARQLERNTLYDTRQRTLRRQGLLLRLRLVNGRALLTFKGRAYSSRLYKVRPEAETHVGSAEAARAILTGLGFAPTFRYEKYRTAYARRGEAGQVVLDETPIGTFLELEGPPRWIRRVARGLGRPPADFLTATYADLYRSWRRRHGGPADAMVFRQRL